jgi:hypothetical protein
VFSWTYPPSLNIRPVINRPPSILLSSLVAVKFIVTCNSNCIYRGADKSLARPTSRCILFDGENISFDASLVIYIVLIFLQL